MHKSEPRCASQNAAREGKRDAHDVGSRKQLITLTARCVRVSHRGKMPRQIPLHGVWRPVMYELRREQLPGVLHANPRIDLRDALRGNGRNQQDVQFVV